MAGTEISHWALQSRVVQIYDRLHYSYTESIYIRSFGNAQVAIPLVTWDYQALPSFTSVSILATWGQSWWRALRGGSWWWPLFPQPFGKLECCSSAKEIPSLGEYILCTLQLHPSSLKTFQATYLNSSHTVMHRCPRRLLLLVCSFLSSDPCVAAAKQPVNIRSFMCFQNQAWCFQHIVSFSCAQTAV